MTIHEPRIPIYSNVTAQPFKDAAEIAALLPRQLVEAVQWEGTIRALLGAGETTAPPQRHHSALSVAAVRTPACAQWAS